MIFHAAEQLRFVRSDVLHDLVARDAPLLSSDIDIPSEDLLKNSRCEESGVKQECMPADNAIKCSPLGLGHMIEVGSAGSSAT